MNAITFDKLAYVAALQASGFNQEQAAAQANALDAALRETVATKSDISDVRHEIELVRHEVELVRRDIQNVEIRLDGKMQHEIALVRRDIQNVEARLDGKITLLQWMLALVIIATVIPLIRSLL